MAKSRFDVASLDSTNRAKAYIQHGVLLYLELVRRRCRREDMFRRGTFLASLTLWGSTLPS